MEIRDYKAEFRACEEQLSDIHGLKELFDVWKRAQDIEIDELESIIAEKQAGYESGNEKSEKEIFETEIYGVKGKKNASTISSHFLNGFQVDIWGEKLWTRVLKNAFKPDGCVGTFQIPEQGYAYIFLLKEANDSESSRPENYPDDVLTEGKVNEWLQDWIAGKSDKYRLLNELLKTMQKQTKNENLSKEEFVTIAAYMNVNKRGGTSSTRGRDETSVLNYAEKYRKFILKEICLLAENQSEVTVFAGGGEKYFKSLMNALKVREPLNYIDVDSGKRINFIHIIHPSARGFLQRIRN